MFISPKTSLEFLCPSVGFCILAIYAQLLVADSDIEVVSFEVHPETWNETLSPDAVIFYLRNNGPDDLLQIQGAAPRLLNLHFKISDNDQPNEADLTVATFQAPFELLAGAEQRFDMVGINRSTLRIPSRPEPYHWYLEIEANGFDDPVATNNIAFAPNPTTITSMNEDIFAVFSGPQILLNNMEIEVFDCFAYNAYYGNNWRIECNEGGSGFNVLFESPEPQRYELRVTHLSSYAQGCPGDGYSPVTIINNGNPIAENYDPAQNHESTHTYVTDTWTISADQGENILEWFGEETCTHYWIQQIVIAPIQIQLQIKHAQEATTEMIITNPGNLHLGIESSEDLKTWQTYAEIKNSNKIETLPLPETYKSQRQFFRAIAE